MAVTLNGDAATLYVNGVPVADGAADLVNPLEDHRYERE